jgi:transcriptional regulator with XRE-family HTH domain
MAVDRDRQATLPSTEARIGEVLKQHRERQGLSLRTLGARAGFSASFLSQVETGQVSPSIASLGRIASELGLTLAGLFAASDAPTAVVVRADERQGFTSTWSRARVESLMPAGGDPRSLESMAVTLAPGGMSGKHLVTHATDQFVYVLSGAVTLFLDNEHIDLREGDAAFIRKRSPHRWENRFRSKTQILIVSSRIQS